MMTAIAPTNSLRIKKARRSIPDGASRVVRISKEELRGSFPLASESQIHGAPSLPLRSARRGEA
jgi:hypothetical protein